MNARHAIIGTGLIGASVGLALRRTRGGGGSAGLSFDIIGWDPDKKASALARRRGAIDRAAKSLTAAAASADIIVLAAPVGAVPALVAAAVVHAKPGALIIDVAGVKAPIERAMRAAASRRPDVLFAGGHPLAGNAGRGAAAASADLFDRAAFALVIPPQRQALRALRTAKRWVRSLGAVPIAGSATAHDTAVAATSALPQLVSTALALAVVRAAGKSGARWSGPGLAEATRLASSSFAQWGDGIKANRRAIVAAIRAFESSFRQVAAAARAGDAAAARRLAALFARGAAAKARIDRMRPSRQTAKRRK